MLTVPVLLGAGLPEPPAGVGLVRLSDETGSVEVQLRREWCKSGRGLADGGAFAQMDPIHTGLVPKLSKRAGSETCLWTGYRPGAHEQPGDTLLTYAMLIELHGEALTGLWYEDHREVPRTYYQATGSLDGRALRLELVDSEGGPPAVLEGLLIDSD